MTISTDVVTCSCLHVAAKLFAGFGRLSTCNFAVRLSAG